VQYYFLAHTIYTEEKKLMAVRTASAVWNGGLQDGNGTMQLSSGAFEGQYSFSSRFEEGTGTNPEELIGAAHAGCFSMALSAGLGRAGFTPTRVATSARVHLTKGDAGFQISKIELDTEAAVPGIDDAAFQEQAEAAKQGCPVSQALAGVEIVLNAKLV
jgi:osmotically inducible protein OsmC